MAKGCHRPFAVMCSLFLVCAAGEAVERYEVLIERNVPARMRDGVVLRADVFRPKAEGRFPVLLARSPYNKEGAGKFPVKAAGRGYVVVIQDCRGRFASEGEWYPFKNEAEDGYDTIEWAAQLPYSNGKGGLIESSYMGATNCSPRFLNLRISLGFCRSSPPLVTMMGGFIRVGPLSCGSAKHGPVAIWRQEADAAGNL